MAKAAEKAVAPAAEKSLYRLRRRYWDGRAEHEIDSVLYFVPGTQPKTAVLVTEQSLPEMEAPAPAPATEDDDE